MTGTLFHLVVAGAAIAWAIFGFWAAAHALMFKRDPRSALGWALLCLLAPYIGPLVYLGFGVNRISSHAERLGYLPALASFSGRARAVQNEFEPPPEAAELFHISDRIAHRQIVPGNDIRAFNSGDEVFAAAREDIRNARHSVMLATYIFRTDKTGRQFTDALADAAARGVVVHVLVDGIGELYSLPRVTRILRTTEVRTARFIPISLIPPALHINLRNHRKLIVIDGMIGYTGGMNIGNQHVADEHGDIPVADMHFRVTGPVVSQLEEVFIADWHFSTHESIASSDIEAPPVAATVAGAWARVIADGPDDDLGKIELILQSAVAAAQHSVRIMTPYFLPPRSLIAALKSAALRGVKVDIVLPEKSNLRYVDWATRNLLWEIVKWDVRVWYQPPPFAHTKLFIIDGRYAHIGSANIDPRSLRLNFEIAVETYDADFGGTLTRHIDDVIARSRNVSLEEVDGRSLPVRLRDSICWLFSPYL